MSAHSPAPWKFQDWGSQILDAREGSAQSLVATVAINSFRDEGRHNARLIAAAPELLDALEAACSLIIAEVADGAYTEQAKAARSAINKATRRTV